MTQEPDTTSDARTRAHGPDRETLLMAAVLLGEDGWHDERIAAHLNVSRRTLARWKNREDMRLALDALALVQRRTFNRHNLDRLYGYWPADIGPQSPNEWDRGTS